MGCKIVHIADDGLQHCLGFIVHASNPQLCSHFHRKQFVIKMESANALINEVQQQLLELAEDTQLQQGLRAAAVPAVGDVTILGIFGIDFDFDWTRRRQRRSGRGHGTKPKQWPVRLFAPDPQSIPIPWKLFDPSLLQRCQHVCR